MQITIGDEDYQTISRCLLGLHTYFFTLHYRFPNTVSEERLLCMLLVLRSICDKIFAYQPVQENISHTIKATLQRYFRLKNQAHVPTEQALNWFEEVFGASTLVKSFVEKGAVNDISDYLSQTLRHNALDALRAAVPQTGKSLRQSNLEEISNGKVLISAEECAKCWAQYGPRSDTPANRFKNAFVRGKYLVLLKDEALLAALTDPSLYPVLDSNGKRACVRIISAAFPLMNDDQKRRIEQLTNGVMKDYRDELLSLRHRCHAGQYGLMDLFHAGNKDQLKQGLLDFGRALVKNKGLCFYIDYDLSSVSWSELDGFGEAVNGLVDLLHRDFMQHLDRPRYALWENDTFKIIWLVCVVWFRKLFHELQESAEPYKEC